MRDTGFTLSRMNYAPLVLVHGAEQTAPAAGTILADTLALSTSLPIQTVLVIASCAVTDTAANLIQLAHRNAANSADIELEDAQSGVLAGGQGDVVIFGLFNLTATGERFVVRNKNAGTAALFYQANVYVYGFPT